MKKGNKNRILEIMKEQKATVVFVTSDDQFFISKNHAQNHAVRKHGKLRDKPLKIEEVTAADVSIEPETSELAKEKLQGKYDELFEKHENAVNFTEGKQAAFDITKKEAEEAKGTDKEAEKNEAEKKAGIVLKGSKTKAENLAEALKEIETAIEEFED